MFRNAVYLLNNTLTFTSLGVFSRLHVESDEDIDDSDSISKTSSNSDEESEISFDFRKYPISIDWKQVQETFIEPTESNISI